MDDERTIDEELRADGTVVADPGPPDNRSVSETERQATAAPVRRYLHVRAARAGWWVSKAIYKAAERFLWDDGLYMASALAFSLILAIFPFIIFMTALTGFVGGPRLAAWLTTTLFGALPAQVAEALEPEVWNVLIRDAGGGLLTFSLLVMLISVSSAVETVRGGLNRAYGLPEDRSVFRTRIESIAYVILLTLALIIVAFVAVVVPVGYAALMQHLPEIEQLHLNFELARRTLLILVLVLMLYSIHRLLPAHKSPRPAFWPGILATLILWWIGGKLFSWYLGSFANYARVYAGLAGIVAAMIFFYLASTILLYAGALNRALHEGRTRPKRLSALLFRRWRK
ncbi:YihY/virulence factor BrkB family protein [Microbaculum marinum]|uniref:YihY/virulence factor BrkB family protein n=1 Tax=Microbaculum marinum TaxID=1764581 RepID=A0AAW9RQ68_9HYPH